MLSSINIKGKVVVKSPEDAKQVFTVMQKWRKNQVLKGRQGRRLWEQGMWNK